MNATPSSRLALTGWAFVLTIFGVFALLVGFTLTTLGLALLPLVLLVTTSLVRGFATVERYVAARTLGAPIRVPYRPLAGTARQRVRTVLSDPATWRDIGWLGVGAVPGVLLTVPVLVLAAGVLWYAAFPYLWHVTPNGLFRADYGVVVIDSQATSFIAWPMALVVFALWWWLTPRLMHGRAELARALLGPTHAAALRLRVAELTATRTEAVDAGAAELRRIERDLHDGVQARLVSLGMSLGLAVEMLDRDPVATRALLIEARDATVDGLAELRCVVRGMHPPVLADRGLVGAVQAAALASPLDVTVRSDDVGRLPAPVESALYFAVTELLTNVARHSGADHGWVQLRHVGGRLAVTVGDDGHGGALVGAGTGLIGVQRRLAAFDGALGVTSPPGGPTVIVMDVPCE